MLASSTILPVRAKVAALNNLQAVLSPHSSKVGREYQPVTVVLHDIEQATLRSLSRFFCPATAIFLAGHDQAEWVISLTPAISINKDYHPETRGAEQ